MSGRVLIVDDEPSICWSLSQALQDEGYHARTASSAEEAFEQLQELTADVILLDVRLPGISGLEAIEQLRKQSPDSRIVIMTAFGDLTTAVTAIQREAFDYLTKPFELDAALEVVSRAQASLQPAVMPTVPQAGPDGILGSSPQMQAVFKQIALAAQTDVPVLITGESGTGKELVAGAIHRHSRRGDQPFLPICLAAMNENLIESELFGHAKGAFTGADRERTGALALAQGGSVFLDEIGDVSLAMQVKLLRAIESHQWLPVGDSQPKTGDFRVIAATHRPLIQMIQDQTFREDLYFRLAVFHIELPPLRQRVQDIEPLAIFFLDQLRESVGDKRLSPDALAELQQRHWQGNVRELKNTVERAAILARGAEIQADHLPAPILTSPPTHDTSDQIAQRIETWAADLLNRQPPEEQLYERLLELVEPPLLQAALQRTGGNRVAAAQRLGIHRTTLRQKLRRYEIEPGDDN